MMPGSDQASDTSTAAGSAKRTGDGVVGEPRWHMAGAVVAAMVLTILLPDELRPGPPWVLLVIEGVLLVAVIASDPGKINRRSRLLRALSIVLVSVLVLGALWATVLLIDDLIHAWIRSSISRTVAHNAPRTSTDTSTIESARSSRERRLIFPGSLAITATSNTPSMTRSTHGGPGRSSSGRRIVRTIAATTAPAMCQRGSPTTPSPVRLAEPAAVDVSLA